MAPVDHKCGRITESSDVDSRSHITVHQTVG